jgi:hypothetical protein
MLGGCVSVSACHPLAMLNVHVCYLAFPNFFSSPTTAAGGKIVVINVKIENGLCDIKAEKSLTLVRRCRNHPHKYSFINADIGKWHKLKSGGDGEKYLIYENGKFSRKER